MNNHVDQVASYWSAPPVMPARTRWWQSAAIVRHINQRISGVASEGTHGGDRDLLRSLAGGAPFARAVSVGCGSAMHEIELLKAGVVGHFDLHEIAPARIEAIRRNAAPAGLASRITVRTEDPFAAPLADQYDLVYWKDALHHMYPCLDAVGWSRTVLKTGGLFFINECVAPTYMQWTERQLALTAQVRARLPRRYLADPFHPGQFQPAARRRPTVAAMRAGDPSECIDSGNILPSVRAVFPNATIIPTGGIVYMLALNDILSNMHEQNDDGLLAMLMALDDLYCEAGDYVYAVAYAQKCDPAAAWSSGCAPACVEAEHHDGSGTAVDWRGDGISL